MKYLESLKNLIDRDWIIRAGTSSPDWPTNSLTWAALGLCGEAGEVGDVVKNAVFYRNAGDPVKVDFEALAMECGDVLHYLMAILALNGMTLEQAAEANLRKMAARFPDGWNPEDAKAKRDVEKK